MTCYLILTEYKNPERIKSILNQHFPDGYSMMKALGIWKGKEEDSLSILAANVNPDQVQAAALDIKNANEQEAVMIIALPCAVDMI